MPASKLEPLACSAESAGLSRARAPGQVVQVCPLKGHGETSSNIAGMGKSSQPEWCYEECDLASMTFGLKAGETTLTRTLTEKLRLNPVAMSAFREYHPDLRAHDLVIETLSDEPDGTPECSLEVAVSGTNKATHSVKTIPQHPQISIEGSGNDHKGSATLRAKVYCPDLSQGFGGLAGIWPFGGSRKREVVLKAQSCGNLRPEQVPLTDLSVYLHVFPSVQWLIEVEAPTQMMEGFKEAKRHSWSKSSSRDFVERGNELTGKVGSATSTNKTQLINKHGELVAKTEQSVSGGFGEGNGKQSSSKKEFEYVSSTSLVKQHVKTGNLKDFGNRKKNEYANQASKFSIELKVAGQKRKCNASEIINSLLKAKGVFDAFLSAITSSIKVGYSVDAKLELFEGVFKLGFGYRIPQEYREEDRVYYVERYIGIGAEVAIVQFSFEVFFGVEVDAWFAGAHAKIYLLFSAGLNLSADRNLSWTKLADGMDLEHEFALTGAPSFEVGGSAGWYCGGKSWKSAVILSAKAEVEGKLILSSKYAPKLSAKAKLGKAAIYHVAIDTSKALNEKKELMQLWDEKEIYENPNLLA